MDKHVKRLEAISKTSHSVTEQSADEFIKIIKKKYPDNSWKNNTKVAILFKKFESHLEWKNESWAQKKLEILHAFKGQRNDLAGQVTPTQNLTKQTAAVKIPKPTPRPQKANIKTPDHQGTKPNSHESIAQKLISSNIETQWKREIFLFQTYINKINVNSDQIQVDGVWGNQTREAILNNRSAAQVFLRELGAKNTSWDHVGKILWVDGIWWDNTQAAIEQYFGEVIHYNPEALPATTVDSDITLAKWPLASEKLLKKIDITPELAIKKARKVLWIKNNIEGEAFKKKVAEFQKGHNLRIDGIIGANVYEELESQQYFTHDNGSLKAEFTTEKFLTSERLKEIKNSLMYWEFGSTNHVAIRTALQLLQKNNPDFARKQTTFFKWLNTQESRYEKSAKWKKTKEASEKQSRDFYSIIKDPNLTTTEKIKAIASDPTTLLIGGLLFLFGIVGWDTKYTNSFMKRVWWILGGVILGPAAWEKLGGWKALDDLGDYWNSPERKTAYENGKKLAEDTADTVYKSIPWVNTSGIWEAYDSVWASITTLHGNILQKWGPTVSDENLPKFTTLTGLPTFWNLSKSDLGKISDYKSLEKVIWAEKMKELDLSSKDDTDIKNFIQTYFLPQMEVDDKFVKDMFISVQIEESFENFFSSFNGNYGIDSPKQNDAIKTDISNIINSPSSSEIIKNAAQDFAKVSQKGDLSDFSIDNHPSLSQDEKDILTPIVKKVSYIFSIQKSILDHTKEISNIDIKNQRSYQSNHDTASTLAEKFTLINTIKSENDSVKVWLGTSQNGIDTKDFAWEKVDFTYQNKKIEILTAAKDLNLEELGGINIINELREIQLDQELITSKQEIKQLLDETIENLPSSSSTPIEMRDWYDTNISHINTLKEKRIEIKDSINGEFLSQIDEAIMLEEMFIERYKERRQKSVDTLQLFTWDLDRIVNKSIDNGHEFGQRKEEILNLALKINTVMNDINAENLWHVKSFWKDLFSNDYTEFVWGKHANSIYDLDEKLKLTGLESLGIKSLIGEIRKTVRTIEENFSVDIWVDSIDIANENTIARAAQKLERLSKVTDKWALTYANLDVLERKREEIKQQVQDINLLFIHAINQSTNINDLGNIESKYRVHFEGKFSSYWKDIKLAVGVLDDPVRTAYDEKKEEFEKQSRNIELNKKLKALEISISEFDAVPAKFLKDTLMQDGVSFPVNGYDLKVKLEIYALNSSNDQEKIQKTIDLIISAANNK